MNGKVESVQNIQNAGRPHQHLEGRVARCSRQGTLARVGTQKFPKVPAIGDEAR